eukprot:jgi/Chlat1/8812/Chrsp90S09253
MSSCSGSGGQSPVSQSNTVSVVQVSDLSSAVQNKAQCPSNVAIVTQKNINTGGGGGGDVSQSNIALIDQINYSNLPGGTLLQCLGSNVNVNNQQQPITPGQVGASNAVADASATVRAADAPTEAPAPVPATPVTGCPSGLNATSLCDFVTSQSFTTVPVFDLRAEASHNTLLDGPIQFFGPKTGVNQTVTSANANAGFFYISGSLTNSQAPVQNFANRCILLLLTSVQIGSLNLNLGDNNANFPQARRCVVFQTGP